MVIDFSRLNGTPSPSGGRTGGVNNEKPSSATLTKTPDAPQQPSAQRGESVQLSAQAQQLQNLTGNMRQLPDVDNERVNRLKQAIADGSYQVDNQRLASKLVNFEAAR